MENANYVVFAKSGAGKSYAVKLEVLRSLMVGTEVIIVDPENEYKHLADAVGGTYLNISLNSDFRINPFDLPIGLEDEDNADILRSSVISILGLMNLILGKLDPTEEALLDKAIWQAYAKKDITERSDFRTGEDKALGAMLSRGFKNDNLLPLFRSNGFSLYDASTRQEMFISSSEYVNDAFIAPDNTLVATNGGGFMIKNVLTGETKTLDTKPESSGWAWFSDSKRTLGFKENNENLYEAGHGRDLGIWNIETGTFTKIPVTFKVKTLRYAEWLVPDHVARINAGYDDGSHDYLINLDTNKVTDLGETSWALYGGLVVDQKLGLMAALASGGAGDCSAGECSAFIVDTSGAITRITLPRDRHRSSLQIVSPTQLLYISRDLGEEGGYGTTYVTRYDVATKQETRLQEVPDMNTVTLSLTPDKKTWIVGAGKQFIVGEL
jgi:hypothetical protein